MIPPGRLEYEKEIDDGGVSDTGVSWVAVAATAAVLLGLVYALGELVGGLNDGSKPALILVYAVSCFLVAVVQGIFSRAPFYNAVAAGILAMWVSDEVLDVGHTVVLILVCAPAVGGAVTSLVKSAREEAKWEKKMRKPRR